MKKKAPPFIMLDNDNPLSSCIFGGPSARATALGEKVGPQNMADPVGAAISLYNKNL